MSIGIPQIMAYYPKYAYLDNILEKTGKKKLVLHIDLKNALRALYLEPFVKDIVQETIMSRHIDVSIFASFLEFISFHRLYAKKRGIDLEIYCFYERGTSSYHQMFNKDYKASRKITDLFKLGEAYTDIFYKSVAKNLDLISRVGNKLPHCHVIMLEYLDADFIPYYLINRVFENPEKECHIIYSNDKDHYQTLNNDFTYQYIKKPSINIIIDKNDVYKQMLKEDISFDNSYVPLFHAILGDKGDDIPDIPGLKEKTIVKVIYELMEAVGSMDNVFKNIKEGKPIFNNVTCSSPQFKKILDHEKQIISNLHQVSYYLMSEFFDNAANTEIIKKGRMVRETISKTKPIITNGQVIYDTFEKSGITLPVNEQTIYNLFQ